MFSLIPATVIGYTGRSDHFEVLSKFDGFINDGIFSIDKRKFTKLLLDNEIYPTSSVFNCFLNLKRICQKIIFDQLYDQQIGLMKEEIDFILKLVDIRPFATKKLVKGLIEQLPSGSHKKTCVFGALCIDGRQFFRQYSTFNQDIFLQYRKELQRKFRKLILFLDRAAQHYRSSKVRKHLEERKSVIKVEYLPKGSPRLSAVE